MAKKNFSTKKMLAGGLSKPPEVKTNNGPGGYQRQNFVQTGTGPLEPNTRKPAKPGKILKTLAKMAKRRSK